MRRIVFVLAAVVASAGAVSHMAPASGKADREGARIFGGKIPTGYRDWTLISVAHEAGSLDDLRAILGNDVATKAYREGKLPFPDGAIIARLAWSYIPSEKKTKSLAIPNPSWLGHPRKGFSSWSRTQEYTSRPTAGDSPNLTTANLPTKQRSRAVCPAMSPPELATLSTPVMHLEGRMTRGAPV
jgi:Cytochrome P460